MGQGLQLGLQLRSGTHFPSTRVVPGLHVRQVVPLQVAHGSLHLGTHLKSLLTSVKTYLGSQNSHYPLLHFKHPSGHLSHLVPLSSKPLAHPVQTSNSAGSHLEHAPRHLEQFPLSLAANPN